MTAEQKRICQWEGCEVDLSATHPNTRYCYPHSVEARKFGDRERKKVPRKKRICLAQGCEVDITHLHHARKWCDDHRQPDRLQSTELALRDFGSQLVEDAREGVRQDFEAFDAWLTEAIERDEPTAVAFRELALKEGMAEAEAFYLPKLADLWKQQTRGETDKMP